jgi:hypothetical protein
MLELLDPQWCVRAEEPLDAPYELLPVPDTIRARARESRRGSPTCNSGRRAVYNLLS